MDFQTTLMEAVKARYIEVNGEREFGGCSSATQGRYYLRHLEDNLVQPMAPEHREQYGRGSGNELDGKMKSLRSSSAMTFNLLGNRIVAACSGAPFEALDYCIEYEYQLSTLNGNQNPANLDAKLSGIGGGTVAYCEMKMMEWLTSKPSGLREAYLDASNYLIPHDEAAQFVGLFRSLCADEAKDGRIACRLKTYDAFQMCKHLLAVYSGMRTGTEPTPDETWLLNCVWGIQNPDVLGRYASRYRALHEEELAGFAEFKAAAEPIAALFEAMGVRLHIGFASFAEAVGWLEIDSMRRAALERYIF